MNAFIDHLQLAGPGYWQGSVPAEGAASAYRDEPVRLPHRLVTGQPSLVTVMVRPDTR